MLPCILPINLPKGAQAIAHICRVIGFTGFIGLMGSVGFVEVKSTYHPLGDFRAMGKTHRGLYGGIWKQYEERLEIIWGYPQPWRTKWKNMKSPKPLNRAFRDDQLRSFSQVPCRMELGIRK